MLYLIRVGKGNVNHNQLSFRFYQRVLLIAQTCHTILRESMAKSINTNWDQTNHQIYAQFNAAAAKSIQSCLTLCDPIDGSPPGSRPWDSPGKNTGVGCHFLLQCMKVKSESEVAQSCRTLSDRMDYSLPGSSVHGIFQVRVLEWGAIAFSDYTQKKGHKGGWVIRIKLPVWSTDL